MQKNILVSITSLFQYYVFLACIKNNKKTNYKYFILFNNLQITDDTIKTIKQINKNRNIIFIDLRSQLKNNLIFDHKNYINLIKTNINFKDVNEIYLRYKLNTPERVLINLFPKARLNFFEDGLGDYMNPKLFKTYKKYIEIRRLIKEFTLNFIFQFSRNHILKNFYNNKQLKYRIKSLYELIDNDSGHLKKNILKYTNKRLNISINFKDLIEEEYKSKYKEIIKNNSFIVLGHPFLHSFKINDKLENEINIYIKIFNLISLKFNNINIIFKPHPKTPDMVSNLLRKKFPNNINIISKNIISEFLIINNKSLFLGAFLSSSLIYARILNKKIKIFFFNIENLGVKEFDTQSENMKVICTKNNINTLNIN